MEVPHVSTWHLICQNLWFLFCFAFHCSSPLPMPLFPTSSSSWLQWRVYHLSTSMPHGAFCSRLPKFSLGRYHPDFLWIDRSHRTNQQRSTLVVKDGQGRGLVSTSSYMGQEIFPYLLLIPRFLPTLFLICKGAHALRGAGRHMDFA